MACREAPTRDIDEGFGGEEDSDNDGDDDGKVGSNPRESPLTTAPIE